MSIDAECSDPAWTRTMFEREFDSSSSSIFGLRQSGNLLGFLVVHVVCEEAHIINLGVKRLMRGAGLGSMLLRYVLQELACAGIAWVTLEVRRSNAAAQRLYHKMGFVEVGVRTNYYTNNGEDALVFGLRINDFALRDEIREKSGLNPTNQPTLAALRVSNA